jgi:hypothetical protein
VAHRLVGPGHDGHLLHVEAGGQLGDGPMSGDRFSSKLLRRIVL